MKLQMKMTKHLVLGGNMDKQEKNPTKETETAWFGNIWRDEPSQDVDLTKQLADD